MNGRRLSFAMLVALASLCQTAPASSHPSFEATRAELDRLIALRPGDADLLVQRASAYREEGLLSPALVDLDRAAVLDAGRRDVELLKGQILVEAGRAAEGEALLRALVRREPDDARARASHAGALASLGRDAEAAGEWGRAIQAAGEAPVEYHFQRARSLARAHAPDVGPALASLAEAREALGFLVALEAYALELEVGAGLYERALVRLEELASRGERREQWWVRRGEVLALAGRDEEARRELERALAQLAERSPGRRRAPASRDLEERARKTLASLPKPPDEDTR